MRLSGGKKKKGTRNFRNKFQMLLVSHKYWKHVTAKSRKGHISNILRKESKSKRQKLDKIIFDKKTEGNIEVWDIEATVKALEFTENILHHQALGVSDVKFGENEKMKNTLWESLVPLSTIVTIFYLLIAIQEIILEPKLYVFASTFSNKF